MFHLLCGSEWTFSKVGDYINNDGGYRATSVGQGGGETRGCNGGGFNYILVQDKGVAMETEIGTIRNPRV